MHGFVIVSWYVLVFMITSILTGAPGLVECFIFFKCMGSTSFTTCSTMKF